MQSKQFTIIFSVLTLLWLIIVTSMPFFLFPFLMDSYSQQEHTVHTTQQLTALRINDVLPLIAPFFAGMKFYGVFQIIFFFLALLIYLIKGNNGSHLLRFYWMITLIEGVIKCFCLFIVPLHFIWLNGADSIDSHIKESIAFNQKTASIFLLIWSVFAIPIIKFLGNDFKVAKTLNEDSEEILLEVNGITRFLNWFLDMLFFTPFVIYLFLILNKNYAYSGNSLEFMPFMTFYVCIKMLYYMVSEVIFDVSPAKIFTKTSIRDIEGGKATIVQKTIRTVLRFIPFEPITWFLFDKKLGHDEWSDTVVCKEKIKEN